MKRAVFLCLVPVLAAATLLAQAGSSASTGFAASGMESLPSGSQNTAAHSPAPGCPVSMHALQGSGHGLVAVRGKNPRNPEPLEHRVPGQQIHLLLAGPNGARPVKAHIDVYGRSGADHVEQARGLGGINPHDYERHQTLDVDFLPEDTGEGAADLKLRGFTSIKSIQLESVTYEDGSTWRVGPSQTCQVSPDLLMLVAGR